MDKRNKYTVARCLSDAYNKDISLGRYLVNSLIYMMEEMKADLYLYHIVDYESDLRWIMTREVFNWIVCTCVDRQGFYYKSQYNSVGENKCELYGIEVGFVDDELKTKNAEVDLTYIAPYNVSFGYWRKGAEAATRECFNASRTGQSDYFNASRTGQSDYFNASRTGQSDYFNASRTGQSDYFNASRTDVTGTIVIEDAIKSMPWFKYLQHSNAEVKEEKHMKSFYVGCGKKVTIENVIFNNPATIVFWSDGTKTIVKRQRGDKKFDPEKGLAMAICKKIMGNKGNFNNIFKEYIEED